MSYLNTKLTTASRDFISSFIGTQNSRLELFSICLARQLSGCIPVPPEALADAPRYYDLNIRADIQEKLSSISQLLPINVDEVIEHTVRFFSFRYKALHCFSSPRFYGDCNVLEFFGICDTTSKDTIKVIEDAEASTLNRYESGIRSLLRDLFEGKE